ncbi:hypothetical protein SBBP1_20002 [Burkholderiales bacterium]|nr:hypothetical protein SBBP1_20002 [Burkholderiales bacterium]
MADRQGRCRSVSLLNWQRNGAAFRNHPHRNARESAGAVAGAPRAGAAAAGRSDPARGTARAHHAR